MTDKPNEWRDDEGRFLRRDDERGGLEFNGDLTGAITITDEDARFLLRYLPEALGEPRGKPAPTAAEFDRTFGSIPEMRGFQTESGLPAEFDIQAASGDGPIGLTFDPAWLKRMVELDAKIVEAAERLADKIDRSPLVIQDELELIEAVRAKRAAMEKP